MARLIESLDQSIYCERSRYEFAAQLPGGRFISTKHTVSLAMARDERLISLVLGMNGPRCNDGQSASADFGQVRLCIRSFSGLPNEENLETLS